MAVDLYTKVVLTVIAGALCVIAVRGPMLVGSASAQADGLGSGCGETRKTACFVTGTVEVFGSVAVYNKVQIDTGIFGLPVQIMGR